MGTFQSVNSINHDTQATVYLCATSITGTGSKKTPLARVLVDQLKNFVDDFSTSFNSDGNSNVHFELQVENLQQAKVGVLEHLAGTFNFAKYKPSSSQPQFIEKLNFSLHENLSSKLQLESWKIHMHKGLFLLCSLQLSLINASSSFSSLVHLPIEIIFKKLVFAARQNAHNNSSSQKHLIHLSSPSSPVSGSSSISNAALSDCADLSEFQKKNDEEMLLLGHESNSSDKLIQVSLVKRVQMEYSIDQLEEFFVENFGFESPQFFHIARNFIHTPQAALPQRGTQKLHDHQLLFLQQYKSSASTCKQFVKIHAFTYQMFDKSSYQLEVAFHNGYFALFPLSSPTSSSFKVSSSFKAGSSSALHQQQQEALLAQVLPNFSRTIPSHILLVSNSSSPIIFTHHMKTNSMQFSGHLLFTTGRDSFATKKFYPISITDNMTRLVISEYVSLAFLRMWYDLFLLQHVQQQTRQQQQQQEEQQVSSLGFNSILERIPPFIMNMDFLTPKKFEYPIPNSNGSAESISVLLNEAHMVKDLISTTSPNHLRAQGLPSSSLPSRSFKPSSTFADSFEEDGCLFFEGTCIHSPFSLKISHISKTSALLHLRFPTTTATSTTSTTSTTSSTQKHNHYTSRYGTSICELTTEIKTREETERTCRQNPRRIDLENEKTGLTRSYEEQEAHMKRRIEEEVQLNQYVMKRRANSSTLFLEESVEQLLRTLKVRVPSVMKIRDSNSTAQVMTSDEKLVIEQAMHEFLTSSASEQQSQGIGGNNYAGIILSTVQFNLKTLEFRATMQYNCTLSNSYNSKSIDALSLSSSASSSASDGSSSDTSVYRTSFECTLVINYAVFNAYLENVALVVVNANNEKQIREGISLKLEYENEEDAKYLFQKQVYGIWQKSSKQQNDWSLCTIVTTDKN